MAKDPAPRVQASRGSGGKSYLEKLRPFALLLLRLAVAAVFISHGYPKLFAQRHQFLGAFPHMGFPAYFVYISGILELFGGCLLVVGLFTRLLGLLLAGEMCIVLWKVKLPHGLFPVANYQLEMLLAAAAFTLLVLGAGAISLDRALFRSKT